jgi:hypothetical protein
MKNIDADWWNENKRKIALAPAIIFWLVSMICFVFGLSFKNPLGIRVGSVDISIVVAIALSLANTFVQIVGNDQKREDMDTLFYLGWMSSYMLGIGSNVNTLLGILGFGNIYIEWAVCLGLGTMIEVLPEKLLVQFLQSIGVKKSTQTHQQASQSKYKPSHRPDFSRPSPLPESLNKQPSQIQHYRPAPRPQHNLEEV